jgi:hypothetical protein
MFVEAVFTTVKIWSQPRCTTTDDWIKKMCYLFKGVLFSHKEV